MKFKDSVIVFFAFIFILNISYSQVTVEDYNRAVDMLPWHTNALVDRMNVDPNWIDNESFWYKILNAKGEEYVYYHIPTKEKKTSASRSIINDLVEEEPTIDYNRRTEILSPDESKVLYINDWNLWVRDVETGQEKQLTFDGIENFGYATDNAGWRQSERPIVSWSPDGSKISTYQQDQRHVSDMYLVDTRVGAPELKAWKYPLPEDKDIIRIHRVIIDVESGEMVRLKMDPDPRRGTQCDDISCSGEFDDNDWSADGKKLMFVSSSRDHKIAQVRIADVKTGEVTDIFKEEVPTQYESGQGTINWFYLDKTNEFIWYSERDNWGHLYLYNAKNGNLKNQITKGDFVVMEVFHVDEKNRKIIFSANGKEEGRDPYFTHFYSINFNGSDLKLLTPENGNHDLDFSPDYSYFIDNYSQPDIPPVSVLRKIDGTLIETLEKADISRLEASGWKAPIPIKLRSADGNYDLYGLMYTPSNLDPNKKYPIINYIYPGPQGTSVGSRSFRASRGDNQALAELGFVVVNIAGTCNPGRSKAFHDACYGEMGDNTLADQVEGMKQLAEKYPYIDLEHVGIWGHSGGGFATADAMFTYPDFFDVGISESGNHDNRNYEDDWGERYIGLMVDEGNGVTNYERQANQLNAKNLKGKLLLAHGLMDDNVPASNTMLVVDALHEANKDYDLIVFPNARHGFGKDYLYMMRRRWDYFVKHLKNEEPPKEFQIEIKGDPRTNRT